MKRTEKIARLICESRGANPDEPLTVGFADGGSETFDEGWKGYETLAKDIEKLFKR